MIDFAFFGCWDAPGHYMWAEGKRKVDDCKREMLPRGEDLDGSHLFLPYPENVGEGRCTYLPALNVTAFSWWNRVFDTRGAVNSHIIVRGDVGPQTCWNVLQYRFKELAAHHKKPIIGRTY